MILVTGYIKNQSGQPIPSASIQVVDGNFDLTGEGTAANGQGFFFLYINELLFPYGLNVSSVGYKSTVVKLSTFVNNSTVILAENVVDLPPVVVTSGSSNKNLWLIALAGGAFILLNDDKKKRGVNGVAANAINKFKGLPKPLQYGLYGVAGFAVWRIVNSFLQHKNPGKSPAELSAELPTLPAPTYADTQFGVWADRIQEAFDGCDPTFATPWTLSSSGKVLNNILLQLNNDADFAKLVIIYGVRQYDKCGPFTGNFNGNLNQAVTDELGEWEISQINKTLEGRGIKYRF
jgi:hypothetical protein